jgi:hypothetical protein
MRSAVLFKAAVALFLCSAAARPLIGQVNTARKPPRFDTQSATFIVATVAPPPLVYLGEPAVQQELRLTDEQVRVVRQLRARASTARQATHAALGLASRALPPEREAVEARLATALTAEQARRLRQIMHQHRLKEFGTAAALAQLFPDLATTAEQQLDFASMRRDRAEAVVKAVLSGDRFDTINKEVEAGNRDLFERVRDLLSRDQNARLTEMLGKPFAGDIRLTPPVVAGKGMPPKSPYLGLLFGMHFLELDYLVEPAVQDELKMTKDQAGLAFNALSHWNERFGQARAAAPKADGVALAADLSEFTNGAVSTMLKPAQRERLRQILMQRRLRLAGWEGVCGYPGVAAHLKLTQVQIDELKAGKPTGELLTAEQIESLKKLVGDPFRGAVKLKNELAASEEEEVITQPGQRSFPLHVLAAAQRLGLTEEQARRLQELADDEPKVRGLIQRELGYSGTTTVGAPIPSVEIATLQRYAKIVEEKALMVLTEQQRSMWGPKLKGEFLRR